LVLAGGFDKARVGDLIHRHFGNLPAGRAAPARRALRKPQLGDIAKVRIKPIRPGESVRVGLGYAAPLPSSDLYAPFLVVVQRMWKTTSPLGARSPGLTVTFTPLDGPETIAFSTVVEPDETPEAAIGRLESFVAEALKPKLTPEDIMRVSETFGRFLGTVDLPVTTWVQNLYGKAFSIGRRVQLGFDSGELKKALQAVRDEDLQRVAREIFAPEKRAAVIVIPEK
jgi:predicted Zn-dependent peptidase